MNIYLVTAVDSCVSVAAQFQLTEAEFYTMVFYKMQLHRNQITNPFITIAF